MVATQRVVPGNRMSSGNLRKRKQSALFITKESTNFKIYVTETSKPTMRSVVGVPQVWPAALVSDCVVHVAKKPLTSNLKRNARTLLILKNVGKKYWPAGAFP